MLWIECKNAYEMVLQSWMINCLEMYKIHHGSYEKFENRINTWRKNFRWGDDPEMYVPKRCSFNLTICNRDDAI